MIEQETRKSLSAFLRMWRSALRGVEDESSSEELADICQVIDPIELVQMPTGAAERRTDGALWLAPADRFTAEQLEAARRAGGKIVKGYVFPYPARVRVAKRGRDEFPVGSGWVIFREWCGHRREQVAYATSEVVATAVCIASRLRAEESGRCQSKPPAEGAPIGAKA